jgi:hypothetical protein
MKTTVFWNATPCSLVESVNVSEQCTTSIFMAEEQVVKQSASLLFDPEDGDSKFLQNISKLLLDNTA